MEVGIILKIAGIGMFVALICQILSRTGRDDQAMLVSVSGIMIVLILIMDQLRGLIALLRSVFGL